MTAIKDRMLCLSKGGLFLLCADDCLESVTAELSVNDIV